MRFLRSAFLCFLFLSTLMVCYAADDPPDQGKGVDVDAPGEDDRLNRELWERMKKLPYTAALEHIALVQKATPTVSAEVVLPNGWKLAPAGRQSDVGRFPCEAVSYQGKVVVLNAGYYTGNDKPEVSIVDPATGKVQQTLHFDALFPSGQVGRDGDLYISGGISQKVYRVNSRFEKVKEYSIDGYAGALEAVDATHLAVLSLVTSENPADFQRGKFQQGKLSILNTETGAIEQEAQTGYFPYAVRFTGGKFFVALLGENRLQVFDESLHLRKTLEVGRAPQDIVVDGSRLYIINANSDTLSVVDSKKESVVATLDLRDHKTRFGGAPTSCVVEGDHLYVTLAYINAVAVLDKRTGKRLGYIPTGWYPTKVFVDQSYLITLSAKGIRPRRPNPRGPQPGPESKSGPDYVLTLLQGAMGSVPLQEIESHLKSWTHQVKEGSPLYRPQEGFNLPIRHIFYIVRENRTFDQVMGDLPKANGDPFLTLFGREVTPNGHRLAEEFVTLDNYFADGEISVLGHSFTTSGYASPFLEWLGNTAYSGRYRGYPFGTVPAVTSPAYLWDALDARRADYRIYGENYFLYTRGYALFQEAFGPDSEMGKKYYAQMMSLASQGDRGNAFYRFALPYYGQADTPKDALKLLNDPVFAKGLSQFLCGDESLASAFLERPELRRKFAEYLSRYPFNYRSWDLSFSDLDRAQAWKNDFEKQVKRGRVAQLHYIWLPNDHTAGGSSIPLPPEQLVAQNDAALGRIIETISHSPVWKESLILVTEDDAQNGPDHVDATRTVGLAIGPYVKRKTVISDRYDQLSLIRTIGLLLGLAPLNRNDALAVPMFSLFTDQADFQPFTLPQASVHLSDADRVRFQRWENR